MAADRLVVAVGPARARVGGARLWDALEHVLPVTVVPAEDGGAADVAIRLEPGGAPPSGAPVTVAVAPGGDRGPGGPVLTGNGLVHPSLRGCRLPGGTPGAAGVRDARGEVLATRDGRPAWVADGGAHVVDRPPPELPPGTGIGEWLVDGRGADALPFIHVLRDACADRCPPDPPLRAAFLFDDPNLHAARYGWIDYAALAADARAHGYHAAMAMVPLDALHAGRRAVEVFRANAGSLSLLVHGNDHLARELDRPADAAEARAMLATALHRVARFERRTGLRVSRVMAPPHHACGPDVRAALAACGFDALCQVDDRPLSADPRVAGWGIADWADGGLPVIPRIKLPSRDDGSDAAGVEGIAARVAMHAYLGHPVVLYGHHYDTVPDLMPLREAAALVARLGDARWMPLGEIAATNVRCRRSGDVLVVHPGSRRVRLEVPDGVRALTVMAGDPSGEEVVVTWPGGTVRGDAGTALPAGRGPVVVHLVRRSPAPPARVLRPRPLAVARRAASEARDRLGPRIAAARRR
ncbi:MAG: hypothetical protein IT200_04905 [Thermoleophilia bacterium]|nr:hypothetical protein [Thermoleophilia bacterium]